MDTAHLLSPTDPADALSGSSGPYKALNKIDQEVRILTLLAASTDDDEEPIICTLEQTTLSTAGDYVALSYCWGPPGEIRDISVDGALTPVRPNLWHFLYSLRSVRSTIRVWVDYICNWECWGA